MRFAFVCLLCAGCIVSSSSSSVHPWDVRGNYALSYDDKLTIDLNVAGALRHATAGPSDVVNLGVVNGQPLMLDLAAFCAQPAVVCPSEALPPEASIDQTNPEHSLPQHFIDVVSESGARYPGIVDHDQQDTFIVALGGEAGAAQNCVALALSVATGRFTHRGETVAEEPTWLTADGSACEPDSIDGGAAGDCRLQSIAGGVVWAGDAPVDGITDGKILTGYAAACAFAGLDAAATLTLATGFSGTRTGDFDPPVLVDGSASIDAATD